MGGHKPTEGPLRHRTPRPLRPPGPHLGPHKDTPEKRLVQCSLEQVAQASREGRPAPHVIAQAQRDETHPHHTQTGARAAWDGSPGPGGVSLTSPQAGVLPETPLD